MELSTLLGNHLIKTLLDLSPNPIVITDRYSTDVLFASRASKELFGNDLTLRKVSDDFTEAFRPLLIDGIPLQDIETHPSYVVKRVGAIESEIRWSTPKGIRDLKVVCASLDKEIEGRYLCVYSITDITDLKTMNRRKLSELSHEVKNSIGVILGFADLLKDEGNLNGEGSEAIEVIRRNAHHITNVVNSNLEEAKSFEELQRELTVFDVNELCTSVVRSLSLHARAKGLEINFGSTLDSPFVYSNERKMRQIILNLLTNAVKYTELGAVAVRVSSCGERHFQIDFVDTGVGIAQENQLELFAPFSQAHFEEHLKAKGTGLGLYIVRKLADEIAGSVRLIESAEGAGSTFRFIAPHTIN